MKRKAQQPIPFSILIHNNNLNATPPQMTHNRGMSVADNPYLLEKSKRRDVNHVLTYSICNVQKRDLPVTDSSYPY